MPLLPGGGKARDPRHVIRCLTFMTAARGRQANHLTFLPQLASSLMNFAKEKTSWRRGAHKLFANFCFLVFLSFFRARSLQSRPDGMSEHHLKKLKCVSQFCCHVTRGFYCCESAKRIIPSQCLLNAKFFCEHNLEECCGLFLLDTFESSSCCGISSGWELSSLDVCLLLEVNQRIGMGMESEQSEVNEKVGRLAIKLTLTLLKFTLKVEHKWERQFASGSA